jgi:molybdopterin-guanine dinucleotide biosynthesis protein A
LADAEETGFAPIETAGVVLAGGRSTRMGFDKALAPLAGRPLVAHVAARLAPQVDALFLNANGDGGPLAGVASALRHAQSLGAQWLATAPCDAPFLPLDLVARLAAAAGESGAPLAVVAIASGLEPMFALWSTALADEVATALAAGDGGPRGLMTRFGAAEARFDDVDAEAFANLNTPEEFAAAAARLG